MSKIIPKIIMQTAKEKPEQYIINMIHKFTPDWEYIHFIDSEIITYFKNNPLKEFPNIIDKFNSFTIGQHKADLFRYYFLYINGGVFMDSDAMFGVNIDTIIKKYDSIFIKSFMSDACLFNGFIITYPKNPIIYDALKHTYNTENVILKIHYHYLCEELWKIYHNHNLPNMKIYQEHNKAHEGYNNKIYNWGDDNYGEKHGGSIILNDEGETILNHYWHTKIIPDIDNNESIYIGPSNTNIKEIILDKKFNLDKKIIGNIPINKQDHNWTDKFSTELIDNKLIVKRIDENYGWGQNLILPINENKK